MFPIAGPFLQVHLDLDSDLTAPVKSEYARQQRSFTLFDCAKICSNQKPLLFRDVAKYFILNSK